MLCMKSIYGGMLLLLKVTLFHVCFSRFLICANDTKLLKAPRVVVVYFEDILSPHSLPGPRQ